MGLRGLVQRWRVCAAWLLLSAAACLRVAPAEESVAVAAKNLPPKTTLTAVIPESFPPSYFKDPSTGKPSGFAVEVFNEIAHQAGYDVRYVYGKPWEEIHQMVLDGRAAVIPSLLVSPEREKQFCLSDPVETMPVSYILRRSDPAEKVPYPGMRVGTILASAAGEAIKRHPEWGVADIPYDNLNAMLMDLLSGKIDAAMTTVPNILKLALDAGIDDRLRVVSPPVFEARRVIAMRPGDEEMCSRLDPAIAAFVASERYQELYEKWWGKPKPYWTTRRVALAILLALTAGVCLSLFWRYRTVLTLNRQLQQKSGEMEQYFTSAMDLLCIADTKGYFRRLNPAWEGALGYTRAELEGRRFLDLVHPDDLPATLQAVARLSEQEVVVGFANRYRHKDGSYRWIEWRSYPQGKTIFAVARDITDRIKSEAEREQRLRELSALNTVALASNASLSVAQAAEAIISGIVRTVAADVAFLLLRDGDDLCLQHFQPASVLQRIGGFSCRKMGDCLCGICAAESRPVYVRRLGEDAHCVGEECTRAGLVSFAALPVVGRGGLIGVIGLGAMKERDFQQQASFLEALSHQVSSALDNAQLFETTRRMEESLRESEARFRTLLAHMVEGVALHELVLDDDGRAVDYRVLSVNPSFERILGVQAAGVEGKLSREAYGTEEPPFLEAYARVVHSGTAERFERYFPPMERHFDISVAPWGARGFATFFTDITNRKRAEEAATRGLQLLNNTQDCVGMVNLDGVPVYYNPAFLTLLGYAENEFALTTLNHVHTPEEAEKIRREHIPYAFKHGSWRGEGQLLHRDGHLIPVDQAIFPVRDADGRIYAMATIMRDLTERKTLEARLRHSEKMEAIGQLAGGIAHDFNNQLGGIIGNADLLQDRLDDPTLRRYVDNIITASLRSADLTQQMLAFARKGNVRNEPVDIHGLVDETVGLVSHSIDKRITVVRQLGARACIVMGDPAALQNALLNLCINARDAMPSGGELRISTAVEMLEEKSFSSDIAAGAYLQVSVADTGVGMDAETRRRVFEPFFTTKDVGKGTGLGLAAVYGTVRSHHGAIHVYSEPGRGSEFKIYLPLKTQAHEPENVGGQEDAPAKGSAHVLLVDDEDVLRDSAKRILEDLGYRVSVCVDGQEAVDWYALHWRETDLVILDLMMPRLNGRDAFARLKDVNPEAKVLFSSGYSMNANAHKLLEEGACGFLQKPFRLKELGRAVADALK